MFNLLLLWTSVVKSIGARQMSSNAKCVTIWLACCASNMISPLFLICYRSTILTNILFLRGVYIWLLWKWGTGGRNTRRLRPRIWDIYLTHQGISFIHHGISFTHHGTWVQSLARLFFIGGKIIKKTIICTLSLAIIFYLELTGLFLSSCIKYSMWCCVIRSTIFLLSLISSTIICATLRPIPPWSYCKHWKIK